FTHPPTSEHYTLSLHDALPIWRALIRERGDRPHVYGVPWDYLSLLYHLAELPLLTLRWIFASNRQKRFQYRCSVSNGAGQVIELYRRSVGHKTIKTVGV